MTKQDFLVKHPQFRWKAEHEPISFGLAFYIGRLQALVMTLPVQLKIWWLRFDNRRMTKKIARIQREIALMEVQSK